MADSVIPFHFRVDIAEGRRQKARGKSLTIPGIQAHPFVLTYVTTSIHLDQQATATQRREECRFTLS